MSDREVTITYTIKQGQGNQGIYRALGQGASDLETAYGRAAASFTQTMERATGEVVRIGQAGAQQYATAWQTALQQASRLSPAQPATLPHGPKQPAPGFSRPGETPETPRAIRPKIVEPSETPEPPVRLGKFPPQYLMPSAPYGPAP